MEKEKSTPQAPPPVEEKKSKRGGGKKYTMEERHLLHREIVKLARRGFSRNGIANLLIEDGWKRPNGKPLDEVTIYGLVHNMNVHRKAQGLPPIVVRSHGFASVAEEEEERAASPHHVLPISDEPEDPYVAPTPLPTPDPKPPVVVQAPPVAPPTPPAPAPVPPPAPTAPAATSSLPISVSLVLDDPGISDTRKIAVLRAVANRLPPSVALLLDDDLSDTEKLSLVRLLTGGAR